jgi:hypothetical protein
MANIKISELNPLLTVEDADVLPIVDNAVTKKVTAAILRTYTQGNSVLLTGNQTIAGIKTFTSQLASSVATGTAPFSVASTTKVTNLNADLLDGLSSADFQATLSGTGIVKSTAGTISYLTDNSTNWNTAFNDKINSAAVTGSGTNTLTLTQQDAGTITATWVNGTLIREIRNNTGATLTKGTIVYISGATGNKPTVSKAIATGDSTSAQTFGFVQESIANNANGYVVVIGDLTGVDTSAFTEGDQLYLSATVAGAYTSVKQYAPNHLVYVGIVTRSHPTLGQIEVNIQNGYELDELHNVAAQSPSNGDILQYVTSTGLWTKIAGTTSAISEGSNLYFTNARSRSAISLTTTGTSGAATYNSTTGVLNVPNYADTDTGITSLNGLTALTQTFAVGTSGTDFGISSATSTHTFNLPTASATNRGALSSADWTTFNNKQNALTNPITGTGTTNYLPKFTGASALGNSIVSDITIGGIPTLNVAGGILSTNNIETSSGYFNATNLFLGKGSDLITGATANDGALMVSGSNNMVFGIALSEKMRITSAGNVGIGTSTPSAGSKLDVRGVLYLDNVTNATPKAIEVWNANGANYGTWYDLGSNNRIGFGGSSTIGGIPSTTLLTLDFNNNNVGIGTTTPSSKLDVTVTGTASYSPSALPTASFNTTTTGTINAAYTSIHIGARGQFGQGQAVAITNVPTADGDSAMAFTTQNGYAYSEKMRIAPSGNVLIGTTTDAGYKLDVNGTARVQGQLAVNHSLSGNYGAIVYNTSATGEGLVVRGGSTASHTSFAVQPYDGSVALFSVVASGAATFASSVSVKSIIGDNTLSIPANLTNYQIFNYAFFGLLVVRDLTNGGSAVYLLDPNGGVNLISSNLGYVLTFTFNGGTVTWDVQKATGGAVNISFLPLQP